MHPNLLLWKDHFLRNIESRYLHNSLGLFWAVLHPLFLFLIYYYVFYQILSVRLPVQEKSAFMPFLAMGLWPWLAFSESLMQSSNAVLEQKGLLNKVRIAPWVLIGAQGMSVFVVHLAGFWLVGLVLWMSLDNSWQIAWLQVAWLWMLLLLFAVACWHVLGLLRVFLRDVGEMLPPLLMLWFLLTPILYSEWIIPEVAREWMRFNPMYYFVTRMRQAMLQGGFDPGWWDVGMLAVVLAVVVMGLWLYRRATPWLEDFL